MKNSLLLRRLARLLKSGSIHSPDYLEYSAFLRDQPVNSSAVINFTIDFELAWSRARRGDGCLNKEEILGRSRRARRALPVLLELAERFSIPITFALVGHVATRSCSDHAAPPKYAPPWVGEDWFALDPKTNLETDKDFYGIDLAELILKCPVKHEIASHGFSHVEWSDNSVNDEVARFEAAESKRLLELLGRPVTTFVFPKNHPARIHILKECAYSAYRGRQLQKTSKDSLGLWQLPLGLWLSPLAASPKEIRGLMKIAADRRIFANFWSHLFEFDSAKSVAEYFEPIFKYAAALRSGGVAILTIQDIIKIQDGEQ